MGICFDWRLASGWRMGSNIEARDKDCANGVNNVLHSQSSGSGNTACALEVKSRHLARSIVSKRIYRQIVGQVAEHDTLMRVRNATRLKSTGILDKRIGCSNISLVKNVTGSLLVSSLWDNVVGQAHDGGGRDPGRTAATSVEGSQEFRARLLLLERVAA